MGIEDMNCYECGKNVVEAKGLYAEKIDGRYRHVCVDCKDGKKS